MKQKYFIESLSFEVTDSDSSDVGKAIISCCDHHDCIVIYGSIHDLTDRCIKIINGLNNNDSS